MPIRLTWDEMNFGEEGHKIYRAEAPMDVANLPAALATIAADTTQYDDTTVVDGTTYYYRVSAFIGSSEQVSDEVSVTAGAGAGDSDFASVTLLMHMDGADASTVFTDEIGHTVTVYGDAQIDDSESKFGGSSALFDGAGDLLTIPYVAADFDWYAEDYTLEYWVYPIALSSFEHSNGGPRSGVIGNFSPSSSSDYWAFGPLADGRVQLSYWSGSGQAVISTETISEGSWSHLAFCVDAGVISLFVNGVLSGQAAIVGVPQSSASQPLTIGQSQGAGINGRLDELRITKGVARYSATFTPPTAPFPDSV